MLKIYRLIVHKAGLETNFKINKSLTKQPRDQEHTILHLEHNLGEQLLPTPLANKKL